MKFILKKLNKFVMGFFYASRGIVSGFAERNMRVHGLVTAIVLFLGVKLGLTREEWFTILILISVVWSAELSNTALEELANIVRDELKLAYVATQRARDTAAGAVWIIAIVAAIIGLWIFVPKIVMLIG